MDLRKLYKYVIKHFKLFNHRNISWETLALGSCNQGWEGERWHHPSTGLLQSLCLHAPSCFSSESLFLFLQMVISFYWGRVYQLASIHVCVQVAPCWLLTPPKQAKLFQFTLLLTLKTKHSILYNTSPKNIIIMLTFAQYFPP